MKSALTVLLMMLALALAACYPGRHRQMQQQLADLQDCNQATHCSPTCRSRSRWPNGSTTTAPPTSSSSPTTSSAALTPTAARRPPSSSRAYPLAFSKKVEAYRRMFEQVKALV